MKKIRTVAAKQAKNFSEQKLTIGLDLGDRSSWYCVLDEAGEVVLEQKLGTTPKALKEVFGGMPRSRIALETGMHSPWVSRVLSELGHEVIVAHARNVRLIGESRKKDDRLDARMLARLARIDPQLLCPVTHRSAKAQADLMVIRARAGLVRARTSHPTVFPAEECVVLAGEKFNAFPVCPRALISKPDRVGSGCPRYPPRAYNLYVLPLAKNPVFLQRTCNEDSVSHNTTSTLYPSSWVVAVITSGGNVRWMESVTHLFKTAVEFINQLAPLQLLVVVYPNRRITLNEGSCGRIECYRTNHR